MNTKILIDTIVYQTTVLIAQLSTASGIRAPLSHVADQVFLQLSREIEAQGVGRKVVADMFGMAIRSYQKKVQRLAESETERGSTLWHAVLNALSAGSMSRRALLKRFSRDPEREVLAVLNDLINSGFVFSTGRGEGARYGVTSDEDRRAMLDSDQLDSLAHVLWLSVQSQEPISRTSLLQRFSAEEELAKQALSQLLQDGRVVERNGTLTAKNFHVPLGASAGWEAAILDHFQAMVSAIGAKLHRPAADEKDTVGGSTLRFSVYSGHPAEGRVFGLLRDVREHVLPLWEEVSRYNEQHPLPETAKQVTFYFGQSVLGELEEESGGAQSVMAKNEARKTDDGKA